MEPEIRFYYERNDERDRLAGGGLSSCGCGTCWNGFCPRRRQRCWTWAALAEARRVARPGGVTVALALSRFYVLLEELVAGDLSRSDEGMARFLADGQYRNPGGDIEAFTTSYFHRPDGLATEVIDAGLRLDRIVGASGIVKLLLPDLSERLHDDAQRESVTGLLRRIEAEPSLLGVSQNLVAIARAPW